MIMGIVSPHGTPLGQPSVPALCDSGGRGGCTVDGPAASETEGEGARIVPMAKRPLPKRPCRGCGSVMPQTL